MSSHPFRTLIVAAPDMVGRLIGRRLPYTSVEQRTISIDVCSSVLAWDVEQTPIDRLSFAGFHTGWHDLEIRADVKNIRSCGWSENTAIAIGTLQKKTGEALPFAPRAILEAEVKKLEALGLSATVATELEFYLFPLNTEVFHSQKRHDYAIDVATNRMSTFFDELSARLARAGIQVESWQAEWGIGQWEVNLAKGNPLAVADAHTLFKLCVKELARTYGYQANFMAKPASDLVGSSSHIHVSLWNANNHNVFFASGAEDRLSSVARSAIEGLLSCAPDLMPLYANNVNSFRRLAANEFCGHGPTWGIDNRTVTCRVIGHAEPSVHLEFRIPGADANPYLALAGVLASLRAGILKGQEVALPTSGDASSRSCGVYPLTLESAHERFRESEFAKQELGEEFVSEYARHIEHECAQFRIAVTDWERSRYGEHL